MAAVSFKYYQDPGHGWIAVRIKVLAMLNLTPSNFSHYSFIKGNTVYLEEDGDASKFFKVWTEKFGEEPSLIHKNTNKSSPIRSYPRIKTNNWVELHTYLEMQQGK